MPKPIDYDITLADIVGIPERYKEIGLALGGYQTETETPKEGFVKVRGFWILRETAKELRDR